MPIYKFYEPIVDSGYFFENEITEISRAGENGNNLLHIRYSLKNLYDKALVIPITITHSLYFDCNLERNFDDFKGRSVYSKEVEYSETNELMYGYGDDHYVKFLPDDKQNFRIIFETGKIEFNTFDIEYYMIPVNGEYGRYRLRYDMNKMKIVNEFCIRTINHKLHGMEIINPPGLKLTKNSKKWRLFGR